MVLRIISDRENKNERGYQEVTGVSVAMPSDGMIEIPLKIAGGEYVKLWMTCKSAREFCDMLNNSLLYHEEFGEQNVYVAVDTQMLILEKTAIRFAKVLKAISILTQSVNEQLNATLINTTKSNRSSMAKHGSRGRQC